MNIVLTGVIESIFNDEWFKEFRKRTFWVKEMKDEKSSNTWEFEMQHDDCDALNKFKTGDVVACQIEVRGKKLRKKNANEEFVITTLKCNGIKKV